MFAPALHEKVQSRRTLDTELRQALGDGALELFYQPLVSLATHRAQGFEALLRWRHPTRGLIMPDAFIPLAETIGLIVPIGAFVLNRACAEAALWPGHPSVAVNLSASEFTSPDIVETVAAALHRAGLDPSRLELEITESTMLRDTHATLETLHKLKELGVRLSIDDFGTGFSSLGYLQRFAFDKVKIDRSFIEPLGRTRELRDRRRDHRPLRQPRHRLDCRRGRDGEPARHPVQARLHGSPGLLLQQAAPGVGYRGALRSVRERVLPEALHPPSR